MQQSSSKANISSASQEISRILLNPTIHCHIPAKCIRGESNQNSPGQPILFLTIRFTIFFPCTPGPFKQSLSISPSNPLCAKRLSPKSAPSPVHLIPLDFITIKMCGDGWISRSSFLCIFLQHPAVSFFFNPNRLLTIPFSNTLSQYSSSSAKDQISNPYKTRHNTIELQIYNTVNQHSITLSQSNITVRCVNWLLYSFPSNNKMRLYHF